MLKTLPARTIAMVAASAVMTVGLLLCRHTSAARADSPPIQINSSRWQWDDPHSVGGDIDVGINFENTTDEVATVVKFDILLEDAFDKVLDIETATDYGTFSPNVVIAPRYDLTGRFLDVAFVGTHAWLISNAYSEQLAAVNTRVAAVRFQDGSIWENPLDNQSSP